MPSTYSTDLRIELIANGEQSGLWGATTNTNLGTLIEDAISGLASVSITSANQALTASNGSADQARCAAVSLTTTTTAAFNVYVPPVTKLYVIKNASAYAATIYCSTVINNTTAAGTGVTIPAGKSVLLRADGTNVVEQLDHVVGNFGVGGNATVTGNTSITGTTTLQNALVLNSSSGTSGQVVVSQGAGNPPVWGNAFVTGMIMMWSGSIASIPSGWVLCNGSSGTPDLRDRFVVGAGSTYAVGATGGSANATLVSHTHTATTTATDSGHSHSYTSTAVPGGSGVASRVGIQVGATTGVGFANITASTSISTEGSSATNANLPPYYALAYIMKL
jgi:microcystin-dependent protein